MIDDLEEMAKVRGTITILRAVAECRRSMQHGLQQYMNYRKMVEKVQSTAPKRIIFYRGAYCYLSEAAVSLIVIFRWCIRGPVPSSHRHRASAH